MQDGPAVRIGNFDFKLGSERTAHQAGIMIYTANQQVVGALAPDPERRFGPARRGREIDADHRVAGTSIAHHPLDEDNQARKREQE
jgi:hypothetical protein